MSEPATPIPTELLTLKSLKTLSGASVTVWIVCLVLNNLLPSHALKDWHYRIIAFVLSVLITITIIHAKKTRDKLAYGLLILGNTCYIFINASGLNSISQNQLFDSSSVSKTDTSGKNGSFYKGKKNTTITAALLPFLKEADWWPDKEVLEENMELKQDLDLLKSNNSAVYTERDQLKSKVSQQEAQIKTLIDSRGTNETDLLGQVTDLNNRIQALTASLNAEKNKNVSLDQAYQDYKRNSEEQIRALKAQVTSLTNLLNEEKTKNAGLTRSLDACNTNYNNCQAQYEQLKKDCISKKDADLLRSQITKLNQSLRDCNTNYDKLKKDCAKKTPGKID